MTEKKYFTAHGFKCRAIKTPMGHWCGYVALPPTHPWHGKDYDDDVKVTPEIANREIDIDKVGVINVFALGLEAKETIEDNILPMVLALDVHGGLTYAEDHAPLGKPDEFWWLGFDCAHAGDAITPEMANEHMTYRELPYVRDECRALAKQLRTIQETNP